MTSDEGWLVTAPRSGGVAVIAPGHPAGAAEAVARLDAELGAATETAPSGPRPTRRRDPGPVTHPADEQVQLAPGRHPWWTGRLTGQVQPFGTPSLATAILSKRREGQQADRSPACVPGRPAALCGGAQEVDRVGRALNCYRRSVQISPGTGPYGKRTTTWQNQTGCTPGRAPARRS